jgi:hypothetical protein
MLARRWASTVPNKFELPQLVPIRGNEHGKPNERRQLGTGSNNERNHPPAAPVAIVKPLDRSGRVKPRENQRHRNDDDLRKKSHFECRVRIGIEGCGNADEVDRNRAGGNAEDGADGNSGSN